MATMVEAPSPAADPVQVRRRRRGRLVLRNTLAGWSFLAPNFIGFALLTMVPVGYLFYLAFTDMRTLQRRAPNWVGFDNFVKMWSDSTFWESLWNTFYFSAVHIPVTFAISLGLAVLLNRKLRGMAFFRTAAFFPYITSIVALVAVWNILLSPGSPGLHFLDSGPINDLLRRIGIDNPPGWAVSSDWSMPAVIIVATWRWMGYYMLLFLAGLQTIPSQLYEAATVDGASAWHKFWHVTLPGLRHTTFFVLVIMTINAFKVFDIILLMTQGGPGTSTLVLSQYIYWEGFDAEHGTFQAGYASAVSIVLFGICFVLTVVQYSINKRNND